MIPFMLLSVLIAKLKGYKIGVLKKAYSLYPIWIAELIYIIGQILVLNQKYNVVRYSFLFKYLFLIPLLIPLLTYKLYKPAILGSGCVVLGTLLNRIVINANNGKMPVFATLSKITGYFNESAMVEFDSVHCLGSSSSKLIFLSDYIDLGYCILSPGDILLRGLIMIFIYSSIVYLNKSNICETGSKDCQII